MKHLIDIGQKLGLEGKELQSFASQQQAIGREERQRECEMKKDELEREKA